MNRALLVGINAYPGAPLQGCINDILDLARFLVANCKFKKSEIRLLTDARATKADILDRLGWLLTGVRAGDRLVFHYSGHGAQMPTRNPQGEVDHLDEVICPVDFDWSDAHALRDKEFASLFGRVPNGVNFIWISDSCHSGDLIRELPNPGPAMRPKRLLPPPDIAWRVETAREMGLEPSSLARSAANPNVALIAGCRSNQTSADATFGGRPNGALTYYLLQELAKAGGAKEPLTSVVKNVRTALAKTHFSQVPQLEGSSKVKKRPFLGAGL